MFYKVTNHKGQVTLYQVGNEVAFINTISATAWGNKFRYLSNQQKLGFKISIEQLSKEEFLKLSDNGKTCRYIDEDFLNPAKARIETERKLSEQESKIAELQKQIDDLQSKKKLAGIPKGTTNETE